MGRFLRCLVGSQPPVLLAQPTTDLVIERFAFVVALVNVPTDAALCPAKVDGSL
jgi:hypothetical protein